MKKVGKKRGCSILSSPTEFKTDSQHGKIDGNAVIVVAVDAAYSALFAVAVTVALVHTDVIVIAVADSADVFDIDNVDAF